MISKLYDGQFGEVIGSSGRSRKFSITGGVRKGCVLSPRLFCAVLLFAMRKWRLKVGDLGFDLWDGMPHLIDLRFADDILLFARSALEVGKLWDSLVAELSEVDLLCNADNTVVLTSQSQPPSTITTEHGIRLKVRQATSHRNGWVACQLRMEDRNKKNLDLQYHLQQAAKAYHANKWILEDRRVPISQRLRYFDSVVSSAACFAGGHRTIYQEHLQTLDIHFRKFCRSIVGPPPYIDWTLAWHKILHTWNDRAAHFARVAKIETGRECVVVRNGNWHLMLFHAPPLDTKSFALATRGAKATRASKTMLGEQIGDVLSLRRIAAQHCELWKQHFNTFLNSGCQ